MNIYMKLFIKNILVGIAVIPLFFHIIILCVNVLRGNVEIRDDISHYKSRFTYMDTFC